MKTTVNGVDHLGDSAGQGRKVHKDGMSENNLKHIKHVPTKESKTTQPLLTYLMYMLGDQTLFGDGGGEGRG